MMREVWKCGDEGHVSRHCFLEVIQTSAENAPVALRGLERNCRGVALTFSPQISDIRIFGSKPMESDGLS